MIWIEDILDATGSTRRIRTAVNVNGVQVTTITIGLDLSGTGTRLRPRHRRQKEIGLNVMFLLHLCVVIGTRVMSAIGGMGTLDRGRLPLGQGLMKVHLVH